MIIGRLLVTGSRDWSNEATIYAALDSFAEHGRPTLVHGACRGADTIAADYWTSLGLTTEPHPANWTRYGRRRAGVIRNQQMVQLGADWCLAFILNESAGASNCVKLCKAAGIPTTIYRERRCRTIVSDLSSSKPDTMTLLQIHNTPPTSLNGPEQPSK